MSLKKSLEEFRQKKRGVFWVTINLYGDVGELLRELKKQRVERCEIRFENDSKDLKGHIDHATIIIKKALKGDLPDELKKIVGRI